MSPEEPGPPGPYTQALEQIEACRSQEGHRLSLRGLTLESLPPEIGGLMFLTHLDLSSNALSTLPPEIGLLSWLEVLDISHNNLAVLPPEIGRLRCLRTLDLGWNSLARLPGEISGLRSLSVLLLTDNQLEGLPESLRELSSLFVLYLHGNPALGLTDEALGECPPLPFRDRDDFYSVNTPTFILDSYFDLRRPSKPEHTPVSDDPATAAFRAMSPAERHEAALASAHAGVDLSSLVEALAAEDAADAKAEPASTDPRSPHPGDRGAEEDPHAPAEPSGAASAPRARLAELAAAGEVRGRPFPKAELSGASSVSRQLGESMALDLRDEMRVKQRKGTILTVLFIVTWALFVVAAGNDLVSADAIVPFSIVSTLVYGILILALKSRDPYRRIERFNRRLDTKDGLACLDSDPRPPVAYFRSFAADAEGIRIVREKTDEEHALKYWSALGPVVSIGSPAEVVPSLGFHRIYCTDARWKEVAELMAEEAVAIILRLGVGGGVRWESDLCSLRFRDKSFLMFTEEEYNRRPEVDGILLPPAWSSNRSPTGSFRYVYADSEEGRWIEDPVAFLRTRPPQNGRGE